MLPQQRSQRRRAIYSDLRRLYFKSEDIDAPLVPRSELDQWGIRVVPVELQTEGEDGEELNFSPSFFKPISQSILTDHPACPGNDNEYPNNLFIELGESNAQGKAREIEKYVDGYVNTLREGLDVYDCGTGMLSQVALLYNCQHLRKGPGRGLGITVFDGFANHEGAWQTMNQMESPDGYYPHMIALVVHDVNGNNESLTIGEIQIAVRALRSRYRNALFEEDDILPVLIISYMGLYHGRILQAHHTGHELVLQVSSLLSFEKEETAPSDLFTRYSVAIPQGLTSRPPIEDDSSCTEG